MIEIILTLFLAVLILIALFEYINFDKEETVEGGIKVSSKHIQQKPQTEDTDRNNSIGIQKYDDQWNRNPNKVLEGSLVLQDKHFDAGSVTQETNVTVNETRNSVNTNKLLKVLEILKLTEKYPGRLSRGDMYQITKCSLFDERPKCHEELASYFIHTTARHDYRAREFRMLRSENKVSSTILTGNILNLFKPAEEKRGLDVSPMDIIIAVFLCCDDICRQDLVSHMWSCRLAIPFVIQEKMHPCPPSCFLWPLRNLVMKWETQRDGKISVREGRLVKERFTSIAFIRVGEIGLSKSALVNSVISMSEKKHSIFFHRNSFGSTKHRYLINGLIDISWYFPMPKSKGKADDHFKEAVMFLNLHGDASKLESYLPILTKLANIMTILCEVEDLDKCRNVITPCLDKGKSVLLIVTDKEIQHDNNEIIRNFITNIRFDKGQLAYLGRADKAKAEFVQETRLLLMKLHAGKPLCLNEVCSLDIEVMIDEKTENFLTPIKEALSVSSILQKTPYKERQSSFLYLQGEPWIKWAAADKEKVRSSCKKKDVHFEKHKADKLEIMNKCRSQQHAFLRKGHTAVIDKFLNSESISNSKNRELFLNLLKFEIDDITRKDLSPVYEKYHTIMQELADAKEAAKKQIRTKLQDVDKEVALCSFGMEHIMREIGQIYEALHHLEPKHSLLKHNLPELAANILLAGYPFELFDGYVNAVPIQWVKDVLKTLDDILKKKHKRTSRIKVISAIGIQSSGKSTMLNALFGCQYAVSAGRCTRGLYCQLIKVEETYSRELGIDYVLAIDTEGLRAPELSASGQMVTHDNELCTFVIGLGDMTILNLMGENTTNLDDLLPISIHAFLRMKLTGFKPKCIIVHQNVNKEDEQKLYHQRRVLEEYLNKMTQMACNIEKTDPKAFKDIIDIDISKDVFYLSALFEGSPPMAPISTRYSEELNILKQHLVKRKDSQNNTLGGFLNRLQILWKAIKTDEFVYHSRNIIETEARSKLDEYWCKANWKFRQPIHDIVQTGFIPIQNTENVNELECLIQSLETKVSTEIATQYSKQKDKFSKFKTKADALMKETMEKWSVDVDKRFDDLSTDLRREMSEKLRLFRQDRERKLSIKDNMARYQVTLRENIMQQVQLVKSSEGKILTKDEICACFEQNWEKWKSEIAENSTIHRTYINIENDAFNALSSAFPSRIAALQKYTKTWSLSSYDIDFKSEGLFAKIIRFFGMQQSQQMTDSLLWKVQDNLKKREKLLQPYSKEDIEAVVQNVKDHLKEKALTWMKPKHEVKLAVIACGHAIKRLEQIHKRYEIETSIGHLLEKEKMHYLRIFTSLYYEAETVSLVQTECQEILINGILHKIEHTLPVNIEKDMKDPKFRLTFKSMAIYNHMVNMAKDGDYANFKLFIQNPHQSISGYISKQIEVYTSQEENLKNNCMLILKETIEQLKKALRKSNLKAHSDFETWLEIFRRETKEYIVLENTNRLLDLVKERQFNLEIFLDSVSQGLKTIENDIIGKMSSYLNDKLESIQNEVIERILKNIIGCTQGCPFCGAICMAACVGHSKEHYTTLHRPQGCNSYHWINTKILATDTCPDDVSSNDQTFVYYENEIEKRCYYRDYKTVYPEWKITADATGEETGFWNCFFNKYAEDIARDAGLKAPEIPMSWKGLCWEEEIEKLEDQIKK